MLDKHTSMVDAFRVADDVLRQGVQGISDLVTLPGIINLDFADVRTIMSEAGNALLGHRHGRGRGARAVEAAQAAVSSPLLETSMEGARSILLSITAGQDLSLWEVNEAAKAVAEAAHPEANIIFGAMVDETLEDQVWVTVVATRLRRASAAAERRSFEEPAGEPRVERRSRPGRPQRERPQRRRRRARRPGVHPPGLTPDAILTAVSSARPPVDRRSSSRSSSAPRTRARSSSSRARSCAAVRTLPVSTPSQSSSRSAIV